MTASAQQINLFGQLIEDGRLARMCKRYGRRFLTYQFANLFWVDGHATFGRDLERFELGNSLDEVAFTLLFLFRAAVGGQLISKSIEVYHLIPRNGG